MGDEFLLCCKEQFERLGVFPNYRFLPRPAKDEYHEWIMRKARRDGRKVNSLIDKVIEECDRLPSLHELAGMWAKLNPIEPEKDCPECHGAAFRVVEINGMEGAVPCARCCLPRPVIPATTGRGGSGDQSLFD